jgi:hypothetical protein
VSTSARTRLPAFSNCAANSHNSGPLPASTVSADGASPDDFSNDCAAPTPITPGSVQPGIGHGRSCAPAAISTARADFERAARRTASRQHRDRLRLQRDLPYRAARRMRAPLACNASTSGRPAT